MDQQQAGQAHRLTWLAVVLAFLLLIPGILVGALIAYVYRFFLSWFVAGGLFDWLSAGWFSEILLVYFPALLAGLVAGGLAIYVTSKILRHANYEIVMYATAAIVIAFTILSLLLNFGQHGLNLTILEIAANTFGIVMGLHVGHKSIAEERAGA